MQRTQTFKRSLPLFAALALLGCAAGTSSPVSPEIAAFNGDWTLSFTSDSRIGDLGAQCEDGTGSVKIENGTVRGRSVIGTVPLVATGTIDADGAVSARFTTDQVSVGEATGQAEGNTMSGRFQDDFGCAGSWTATRA